MNFKGFKSGTDIRGYGAEQFSDEPLYLSDEFVMAVAESFANWLGARTGKYTNEITADSIQIKGRKRKYYSVQDRLYPHVVIQ